jgi:hypothetical protein
LCHSPPPAVALRQLCNCLHAANFAVPAEELATLRLMLYPMALNGQMCHDRTRA